MRFATIVAFILPLAAFAAPAPASRRADTQVSNALADAVGRYNLGVTTTLTTLNSITDQLVGSDNPQEQSALNAVNYAASNITLVSVNLGGDNADVNRFVQRNTNAQTILMNLDQRVNEISFFENLDDNFNVNMLHSNTRDAVDAINKTAQASNDISLICHTPENGCDISKLGIALGGFRV